MAGYAESVTRAMVPVPTETSAEIIQELPHASVVLSRARRTTMSSKTRTQPVLDVLPAAYWVNGDTGLKQTSHAEWGSLTMTAEEIAVLIPIPDAVIADSSVPIWSEIRPLIAEAFGKVIDLAAIWGVDKPSTWPTALVPGAINAGNVATLSTSGTKMDLGQAAAKIGQLVAEDGYAINGFASRPGLNWQLVGLRDTSGQAIYGQPLAQGQPGSLYGYPLNEVYNGSFDTRVAELIGADWSKMIVGIRQDMTYKLMTEAVISNADGEVIFNAAQQDSTIMRVVMRIGYQIAKPLTRVGGATRYPAGVVAPESTKWVASTVYAKGDVVIAGGMIFEVTTAGTSSSSAPTWAGTALAGTVADGSTLVWTRIG